MPNSGDLTSYRRALGFLVRVKLEPYWDTSAPEGHRVLFRKIAHEGGVYSVTQQRQEQIWPQLVHALALRTKEDVARVRKEIRGQVQQKR